MGMQVRHRLEELMIITLIGLQILDFLELLPGDLDFLKKIHSWIVLGYLFMRVSLSMVFFGIKVVWFDISIIFSYFLFFAKDLAAIAGVGLEEAGFTRPLLEFLSVNGPFIEQYAFTAAGISLIFLALLAAKKIQISGISFLGVLHEDIPHKYPHRAAAIFLALVAFFILVFNLAMEWLAVAVDAPLTVLAILAYLFIIIRYHRHFAPDTLLHKVGDVGEKFYENFLRLLSTKEHLSMSLLGLLALHALTDIGNFIIPYLSGFQDSLYFSQLGPGHDPLIALFRSDILGAGFFGAIAAAAVYLGNAAAMLFLLVMPSVIVYQLMKHRQLKAANFFQAVILSSLFILFTVPLFTISEISSKGLVGVDISTQSIAESQSWISRFIPDTAAKADAAMLLAFALLLAVFFMDYARSLRKDFFVLIVLIGLVFFGEYVYYFLKDTVEYYSSSVQMLVSQGEFFISFYFLLFLGMNILLYVGGYLLFWYEVLKHHFFVGETPQSPASGWNG